MSNSHKKYTTFSITIAIRSVEILGSSQQKMLSEYIENLSSRWIIAIEKYGQKHAHYQLGAILATPERIDNVKTKLVTFINKTMNISLTDDNIKHGICVKAHKSFDILSNYCLKEIVGFPDNTGKLVSIDDETKHMKLPDCTCDEDWHLKHDCLLHYSNYMKLKDYLYEIDEIKPLSKYSQT